MQDSPTVIVDTDVVSFLFKSHPLAVNYYSLIDDHRIGIALATAAEIEFGMLKDQWGLRRRDLMYRFLGHYTIVNPTAETALCWAKIKIQCQRQGRVSSPNDNWIAATALQFDLPLITHNASDYLAVEGLAVLTA